MITRRLALFLLPAAFVAAQTPVVLVSIDTLRADHLGAYGYRRIRTPNLDGFANGGTLFTAISSQIPLTLPSHASLFTSTYPFHLGVQENGERVPAGAVTLASILRAHGYRTAAFLGSAILAQSSGLDAGFDIYNAPFQTASDAPLAQLSMRVRLDGALVTRSAGQWMEANRDTPAFVFVHLFDLHTPYSARARGLTGAAGYDAELAYVDSLAGRLRATLERLGWWRRALVIVLSDHGEGLGDHGESSHGYFIYQSTIWVPLIVHWPEGAARKLPARVTTAAGLIDVAPTVLDWLGIARPPTFEGRSLLDGAPGSAAYSETVYPRDAFGWAALRGARLGGLRYIEAPKPELYDLDRDPGERTNLIHTRPNDAAQLRSRLNGLIARYRPAPAQAQRRTLPGNRAMLESLGYLAGGARAGAASSGADPKDRIAEYNESARALDAMLSGHLDRAIAAFEKVVAGDKRNLPALGSLGDCYRRNGQPKRAAETWEAALAADPKYAPAAESLGELRLESHDFLAARRAFQQALAAAPDSYVSHFGLGLADERLGRRDEAIVEIGAACRLVPSSSRCQAELQSIEAK